MVKDIKKHKNGLSYDLNGFKYIHINGSPRERGKAYGFFSGEDFKIVQDVMKFNCYESFGKTWEFFIDATVTNLKDKIKKDFKEFYEEMEGITEGINESGFTKTTLDEVITWNNSFTILDSWYGSQSGSNNKEGGGQPDRCSAFIACGDYTTDGKIVCGHNSFTNFIDGQFMNYVVDIKPEKGHRILMQSQPAWIWSGTDFFVTEKGIIGTETTIGGFKEYENNYPISCRIRQAMQYGNTLDDYIEILLKGNSGDYANTWYLGDINTNEIMMFELGLKYHNIQRKKNGYFIGFNGTYDPQIRNMECNNQGFFDVRRHQGARRVRLTDLMEENKGKIDLELAKELIADHYDVYLKKENPCSRTVCSHYELDGREYMSQSDRPLPFQPRGAMDGFVVDTNMTKKMKFCGRWGSSCGIEFDAEKFFDEHRQWIDQKPYVKTRPSQPWTDFEITDNDKEIRSSTNDSKTSTSDSDSSSSTSTSDSDISSSTSTSDSDISSSTTTSKKSKKDKKSRKKKGNKKSKTVKNKNKKILLEEDFIEEE
jgi:hypothetical protein